MSTGDSPDVVKLLRDWTGRGPVTLMIDPLAPGCANLPDLGQVRVLMVELAGEQGETILAGADEEGFGITYGHPTANDNVTARIPWRAVFVFVGSDANGARQARVNPGAVPLLLPGHSEASLRWVMRALGFQDRPRADLEWYVAIDPRLMAMDADRSVFEPEPRDAFRRCMETAPHETVLLVDDRADGVYAPPNWPRALDGHALQLPVARRSPFEDISTDAHELTWSCAFGDQNQTPPVVTKGFFSIPWAAIGAMKHPTLGGWFWPEALPERYRADMMKVPDVVANLDRLRGAPLAKRAELPEGHPPIGILPAPVGVDKPAALADCKARRGGIVLLDTRAPGVVVSEGFKGAALLGLFFGLREIAADVRVEEDGIVAELPDFEGEPASVAAPWKAVFLIGSNEDGARVYAWPEDYPDEIRKGVHLVQDLAKRGADPIEAVGKVEGVVPVDANTKFVLGIGRDPQGRYVMGLRQPFGKNANGQDMSVELQFMLPLGVLH